MKVVLDQKEKSTDRAAYNTLKIDTAAEQLVETRFTADYADGTVQ